MFDEDKENINWWKIITLNGGKNGSKTIIKEKLDYSTKLLVNRIYLKNSLTFNKNQYYKNRQKTKKWTGERVKNPLRSHHKVIDKPVNDDIMKSRGIL